MDILGMLKTFPFIAITRGIHPDAAVQYATAFADAGFQIIETPLNSPKPLESINNMSNHFGNSVLIGAGTVITVEQVEQVKEAGGRVIFSPHCDPAIIGKTKELGLISIPGVATPTEASTALAAGADALKLFPAESISPAALKALKAVLPEETPLIPVGGIDVSTWQPYYNAGAFAFGLGSSLYSPSMPLEETVARAEAFRKSWDDFSH